jgi:KipI family sensor histidine kinase inhibitor
MEGAGAVLLDAAGPALDDDIQRRIWSLAKAMLSEPGIAEAVPGMNNLLVTFDPLTLPPERVEARLLDLWPMMQGDRVAGRDIEVPVIYNGADLSALAAHAGISVADVARLHSAPVYLAYSIGFMPGFAYLSGLDPRLAVPRRPVPRMKIDAGSVIIGGAQAAIMPSAAPSGWHVIGAADLALVDLARDPPSLLQPGDRIRFRIERIVP